MLDDFDDDDVFDDGELASLDDREKQRRRYEYRRDQNCKRMFEVEKEQRRLEKLYLDQRIRKIAAEEIAMVFNVVVAAGFIIAAGYEYGALGWLGGLLVGGFLWWRFERKQSSQYNREENDDLAEDTVTHLRIADFAEAGKDWLWVDGAHLRWNRTFTPPFWDHVRQKARNYSYTPHAQRLDDNKAARARSLPYRLAMDARLRAMDGEWELPGWARLTAEERKSS